jgi:hypothetical protein
MKTSALARPGAPIDVQRSVVPELTGTPSDDIAAVSALGGADVSLFTVNMSARHPDGRDADFLRWHTYDHRPEHYRIPGLRGSLRLVSTPECRAARAHSDGHYDGVDHVMTYLFSDANSVKTGVALSQILRAEGRMPYSLPAIERGDFRLDGMRAAPRIKIGAAVLPWWPARGVYMLLEGGRATGDELVDIPGVGGVWWASTEAQTGSSAAADPLQVTYCFLDGDPVAAAPGFAAALHRRWAAGGIVPRLAAPFYTVIGHDCDRYLP